MKEEKKVLYGIDDRYEISNLGKVYSNHPKATRTKKGTAIQGFQHAGVNKVKILGKTYLIRNLVAEYFLEKENDKEYILFKNWDISDSQLDNIYWASKEDWDDARKIRHNLSDVDKIKKTAYCSACKHIVSINIKPKSQNLSCLNKSRDDSRYRTAFGKKREGDHRYIYGDNKILYLTESERQEYILLYDEICGICRKKITDKKQIHIDHCHKEGFVRGLLCGKCNSGIGMFGDDPEKVKYALKYLLGSTYIDEKEFLKDFDIFYTKELMFK